jgi:hypothetical protein
LCDVNIFPLSEYFFEGNEELLAHASRGWNKDVHTIQPREGTLVVLWLENPFPLQFFG